MWDKDPSRDGRNKGEERKERGWDELSHQEQTPSSVFSSCAGQKEEECEWRDTTMSTQKNLTALSTTVASISVSFPLSHLGLRLPGALIFQLAVPEYNRVFSLRARLVGQCVWPVSRSWDW